MARPKKQPVTFTPPSSQSDPTAIDEMYILNQLAAGKDPLTNTKLPEDHVCQSAPVQRAFRIALSAANTIPFHTFPEGPTRNDIKWDRYEEYLLVTAYRAGASVAHLANFHHRPKEVIRARLLKLKENDRSGFQRRRKPLPNHQFQAQAHPQIMTGASL